MFRVVLRNNCQWPNIFSRFISLNDTEKVIDWVCHLFLSSVDISTTNHVRSIAILSENFKDKSLQDYY